MLRQVGIFDLAQGKLHRLMEQTNYGKGTATTKTSYAGVEKMLNKVSHFWGISSHPSANDMASRVEIERASQSCVNPRIESGNPWSCGGRVRH